MRPALQGMDADTSQCVCDHLAIACDQLAETVAYMHEARSVGIDGAHEALKTLYKLRAEIGFMGGMVNADLADDARAEAAQ